MMQVPLNLLSLGRTIKERRRALGLTQHELAGRARLSRPRIDALENGRVADIGFRNILRILHALELDLRLTELNHQRPTLDDLLLEVDE